ncbi:MAG: hypothetical protein H7833_20755 [Magnetococcus sp. DMHC-1]|nr:hypothetical protein [Magnetococcales bacterium]
MIIKKELMEDYYGDDGVRYQELRVSARIFKFFDTMRVPVEGHLLNLFIEDGTRDAHVLRYVLDKDSDISSRVKIPGYKIVNKGYVVKPHTYKTSFSHPKRAGVGKETRSQYVVGIKIQRSNIGVYIKIFISLFASLLLALSNFFVRPSDVSPRFSLPSAAFFGAVTNSYVANSILPPSGSFGLVDHIAVFGMGTIFLTIALSLMSNHFYVTRNDVPMAYVLDRTMFFLVSCCCLATNVIVPWSALG